MRVLLAFVLSLFATLGFAAEEGELLEAEQAFKFSARMLDAHTIEVQYQIADGYYMYRDKLKFKLQESGVSLGAPQLPAGKVKQDDFFGKVETYRHDVKITLPLNYSGAAPQSVTLKATSQGCADAGVCYPPTEQRAELKLPASAAAPSTGGGMLESLKQLAGGGSADDLLPPDQAFVASLKLRDDGTVLAHFEVAKGYYLYRKKIAFSVKSPTGTSIAKQDFPAGETKQDPNFGQTEVYHTPFDVVLHPAGAKAGDKLSLVVNYQGCAEKGVCYPPTSKTLEVVLKGAAATPSEPAAPAAPVAAQASAEAPAGKASAENAAAESELAKVEQLLKHGSFWVVVASFFGFGLLLALTPCVFPMIPILSGIIVGEGHKLTKGKSFGLSVAYVLGMALTYALAGVAAGMSGTLISNALQNPWALGTGAAIFVALALSMFGFYDLQMPSFIQSKVTTEANRLKGGKFWAVFAMGALSAVIVGPCVAAPLAGALMYIGQSGDLVLGGTALFVMALGMGVPLLLVGLSAGTLLPHAGAWMEGVKNFFGVAMLGIAIWLISPLISSAVHMLLWAALLIISAIHLHAIDPLPPGSSGWTKFWKGVGVIALVGGVSLLIGVLAGSRDILQPLGGLRMATAANAAQVAEAGLKFERVKTVAELERRIQGANGRPVMLDFYADWCVSCKEMERYTFSDVQVAKLLKDALLLQADVTGNSADDKALLKKFGLFGPPGIIFFDHTGNEVKSARIIGYLPPEKFIQQARPRVTGQ